MNKVSIVLFIIQAIAVFGSIVNGNLFSMGLFQLIGFFLPLIIGVVLIVRDNKKKGKQAQTPIDIVLKRVYSLTVTNYNNE